MVFVLVVKMDFLKEIFCFERVGFRIVIKILFVVLCIDFIIVLNFLENCLVEVVFKVGLMGFEDVSFFFVYVSLFVYLYLEYFIVAF